jgi:arsenate reductase
MDSQDATAALNALGQPTRLELFRLLLAHGPNGLAAGELALRLRSAPSTLSFHLRSLEQAGLIAASRQGRQLIYAAQIDRLRILLTFLTEACCDHDPARCGGLGLPPWARPGGKPAMPTKPFNLLFLCTRNSARSIMAEAVLARLGGERFGSFSAGSAPAPEGPMPEVLAQLQAMGHDIAALRSKSWNEFTGAGAPRLDFVIALCDTLDGQACPDFGETVVTAAWPLPDPAKFSGSAIERATLLNEIYAALHRRLSIFLALPFASLSRMALQARLDELADPNLVSRS